MEGEVKNGVPNWLAAAFLMTAVAVDIINRRSEQERTNCSTEIAHANGITAVQGAYYQNALNGFALLAMAEDEARYHEGRTDRVFTVAEGNVSTVYLTPEDGVCLMAEDRMRCIRDDPRTLVFHWARGEDGRLLLVHDIDIDLVTQALTKRGVDRATISIALAQISDP